MLVELRTSCHKPAKHTEWSKKVVLLTVTEAEDVESTEEAEADAIETESVAETDEELASVLELATEALVLAATTFC